MEQEKKNIYAVTDIETTGGSPKTARITEVAVVLHDGEKILDEYQQLVNPGIPVPPYISQITGITDDMLVDAPSFDQIIPALNKFLVGNIFVAHNVQFDYGFIRNEYLRSGAFFEAKHFCTVKMSKKIITGLRSYGLANLTAALGITLEGHHRALNDARATAEVLAILYRENSEMIEQAASGSFGLPMSLPSQLSSEQILNLPYTAGILYYYDLNDNLIGIESSDNLRDYALKRFSKKYKKNQLKSLRSDITKITAFETGNLLTAQLLAEQEQEVLPANRRIFQRKRKMPNIAKALPEHFMLLLKGKAANEKEAVYVRNHQVLAMGTLDDHLQVRSYEAVINKLEKLPSMNNGFLLVVEAISRRQYLEIIQL